MRILFSQFIYNLSSCLSHSLADKQLLPLVQLSQLTWTLPTRATVGSSIQTGQLPSRTLLQDSTQPAFCPFQSMIILLQRGMAKHGQSDADVWHTDDGKCTKQFLSQVSVFTYSSLFGIAADTTQSAFAANSYKRK